MAQKKIIQWSFPQSLTAIELDYRILQNDRSARPDIPALPAISLENSALTLSPWTPNSKLWRPFDLTSQEYRLKSLFSLDFSKIRRYELHR